MTSPTYISIDVETDGPIPGGYSMLSLGAVAFDAQGTEIGSFSCNLRTLPGASSHPPTMLWWDRNREAYAATQVDKREPVEAMEEFDVWLSQFPKPLICLAYPAGFDFTFVYWYLVRFVRNSRFGFQCLDIKTYSSAVLKIPFKEVSKRTMPRSWFSGTQKHSHVAVEDAREQGRIFFNILRSQR